MIFLALGSAVGCTLFDFSRRQVGTKLAAVTAVVAVMIFQTILCIVSSFLETGDMLGFEALFDQTRTWYVFAGLSILTNALANVLFVMAVQRAAFTLVIPLLSLTPAFAATAGWISFGEALGVRQIAAVVIVVAAALWLGWHGEGRKPRPEERSGILLMSITAFLWAITPFFDRACTKDHTISVAAYVGSQCLGVALCLGVATIFSRGLRLQFAGCARVLKSVWPWVLMAAVAASVGLYFQITGVNSVSHVGLFEAVKRSLTMIISLALGRFVLKEHLTVPKIVAAAIMAAGIFLLA